MVVRNRPEGYAKNGKLIFVCGVRRVTLVLPDWFYPAVIGFVLVIFMLIAAFYSICRRAPQSIFDGMHCPFVVVQGLKGTFHYV